MSRKEDPLALGGLNPTAIDEAVANRNAKPAKEPSALDRQKEERLQQREKRLSNPQAAKQDDTAAKAKEETQQGTRQNKRLQRAPSKSCAPPISVTVHRILCDITMCVSSLSSGVAQSV